MLEEQSTITVSMIVELDSRAGIVLNQLAESCPPFHERGSPEVMVVECRRSKAKNTIRCGALWMAERRASKSEMPCSYWTMISPSMMGGIAGELGASRDHPAIGSGPVPAMSGEGPDLTLLDDDQGAVAVTLDLVNPASPRWRLRHEHRDFRPDEADGVTEALQDISGSM
jgi:hypothetical protein